jgi:hypothetical protein
MGLIFTKPSKFWFYYGTDFNLVIRPLGFDGFNFYETLQILILLWDQFQLSN